MTNVSVKRAFHVQHGRSNRLQVLPGAQPLVSGRVPRISRLVALAIRMDQLIRDGIVADQAELARLGRVSPARLTQLMNLLNLAPQIQEELLAWQPSEQGRERLTERSLRLIAAKVAWPKQRRMWKRLISAR